MCILSRIYYITHSQLFQRFPSSLSNYFPFFKFYIVLTNFFLYSDPKCSILCSTPKGKEAGMKMEFNTGIILADLDDLIYGRESYVSER